MPGLAALVHPGAVVDVWGRPHFSRFDPPPGRPHLSPTLATLVRPRSKDAFLEKGLQSRGKGLV